jgi:hypothetical protein
MDASDDYALRKAQRQMGQNGGWTPAIIALIIILVVTRLVTPPEGLGRGVTEAVGTTTRITSP